MPKDIPKILVDMCPKAKNIQIIYVVQQLKTVYITVNYILFELRTALSASYLLVPLILSFRKSVLYFKAQLWLRSLSVKPIIVFSLVYTFSP